MQYIYFVHVMKVTVLANCISKTVERHLFVFTIFTVYSLRHHLTLPLVKCHTKRFQNSSIPYAIRTWHVASQAVAYSMWPWPPPPRKVRKHFLTRYTVKNGISNLYILLKSALKMQEMLFQRPKFQNISMGACPRTPLQLCRHYGLPLTKILVMPLALGYILISKFKYIFMLKFLNK